MLEAPLQASNGAAPRGCPRPGRSPRGSRMARRRCCSRSASAVAAADMGHAQAPRRTPGPRPSAGAPTRRAPRRPRPAPSADPCGSAQGVGVPRLHPAARAPGSPTRLSGSRVADTCRTRSPRRARVAGAEPGQLLATPRPGRHGRTATGSVEHHDGGMVGRDLRRGPERAARWRRPGSGPIRDAMSARVASRRSPMTRSVVSVTAQNTPPTSPDSLGDRTVGAVKQHFSGWPLRSSTK